MKEREEKEKERIKLREVQIIEELEKERVKDE